MNRDEHRRVRESLGTYLLDGMPADERSAVLAHLDGCPDCRADLAEIEPVADALRGVDPRRLDTTPVPPYGLGEQIVARAMRESRRKRPGPGRHVGAAAAAVVGAAIVGAGIIGAAAGFAAGSGPEPPREPVAIQTIDQRVLATATVIPHSWGVEITLDAGGFAAGVAYRVMVLDRAGGQVSAGEFIGTGEQRMLCNLNSSLLRAQAAGFDVLDPTGRVVLHGIL